MFSMTSNDKSEKKESKDQAELRAAVCKFHQGYDSPDALQKIKMLIENRPGILFERYDQFSIVFEELCMGTPNKKLTELLFNLCHELCESARLKREEIEVYLSLKSKCKIKEIKSNETLEKDKLFKLMSLLEHPEDRVNNYSSAYSSNIYSGMGQLYPKLFLKVLEQNTSIPEMRCLSSDIDFLSKALSINPRIKHLVFEPEPEDDEAISRLVHLLSTKPNSITELCFESRTKLYVRTEDIIKLLMLPLESLEFGTLFYPTSPITATPELLNTLARHKTLKELTLTETMGKEFITAALKAIQSNKVIQEICLTDAEEGSRESLTEDEAICSAIIDNILHNLTLQSWRFFCGDFNLLSKKLKESLYLNTTLTKFDIPNSDIWAFLSLEGYQNLHQAIKTNYSITEMPFDQWRITSETKELKTLSEEEIQKQIPQFGSKFIERNVHLKPLIAIINQLRFTHLNDSTLIQQAFKIADSLKEKVSEIYFILGNLFMNNLNDPINAKKAFLKLSQNSPDYQSIRTKWPVLELPLDNEQKYHKEPKEKTKIEIQTQTFLLPQYTSSFIPSSASASTSVHLGDARKAEEPAEEKDEHPAKRTKPGES